MNKETYLAELRKGLKILPQYDRDEAVEFYEEYFDEAGVENEAKVIEELGDPKALAKKILVDVVDRKYEETMAATNASANALVPATYAQDANTGNSAAFGAGAAAATAAGAAMNGTAGFADASGAANAYAASGAYTEGAYGAANSAPQYQQPERTEKDKPSSLKTLWIVLAAIFALPLSPVIFALLIVACVLIFVLFIVLFTFIITFGSLFVTSVPMIILGIAALFLNPIAGMVVLGSGLILFGLGIFGLIGAVALLRVVAHGLAKGFGRIVHKKNRKNKAAQAAA